MSEIEKVFKFQNNNIQILGSHEKVMFFASQIAKAIGYTDTTDAVRKHIWDINKMTIEEYMKESKTSSQSCKPGNLSCKPGVLTNDIKPLKNLNCKTILLSECGVFQLIFSSKLQKAKDFHDWFFSDVLPSIRKTASYQLVPSLKHNQFVILNERDLHENVVSYIRRFYPDVIFNASLGELQDTSEKRILGYKHGYLKGAPDLFILECNDRFNGLSIEFKNPNGKGIVSENQLQVKKKLNERGYKAFHSDDFHYIIKEINEYLSTRRLKCQFCIKKFKSTDTLESHHRFFHRII